jgi:thermitase
VRTVSETFVQFATTASQAMEAERSIVISSFEEEEHRSTTQRTFKNDNHCYAVTYYIRRVNELYESTSRVVTVEWRLSSDGSFRSTRDLANVPNEVQKRLQEVLRDAPRPGESLTDRRHITIPTDGTLYETELAYCSSCEPMREAEMRMDVERRRLDTRRFCLETEAMALEVERRRTLVAQGSSLALLGAGTTGALPPVASTVPALTAPGTPGVPPGT